MSYRWLFLLCLLSCRPATRAEPQSTPASAPKSALVVSSAPASLPVLRLARISPPRTFDPQFISDPEDERIASALFLGLTRCDPKTLQPLPSLADSWESLDGAKRWRFHLKEKLVFSNGEALTADDVLFAWSRLLDPLAPSRSFFLLDPVEGARRYRNGALLRTTQETTLVSSEESVRLSKEEAVDALLADVSEVTYSSPLLDAPSGKKIADLAAGTIVSLVDNNAPPELTQTMLEVQVIASGLTLSGLSMRGFLDHRALRPLYGPTTRAISLMHVKTKSLPMVDAPELDQIQPGEVVAPLKGEFAQKVGEKRLLRVRDVSGEMLGWADASAVEIKTFGATKVFVQTQRGQRGWVSAEEVAPDFSRVGLRVIDAQTIELQLSHPASYLPALLCRVQLAPVPKDQVEKEGFSWASGSKLSGSGPFVMGELLQNGGVSVKRNPNWFGAPPKISGVLFSRFGSDRKKAAEGALQVYSAGSLDALFLETWDVDPSEYSDFFFRQEYQSIEDWQAYHLRVNTSRESLKDPKIRQALALAVNAEDLRYGTTMYSQLFHSLRPRRTFAPSFPGYTPPKVAPHSVEEAKRLWGEAKKRPKRIELLCPDWAISRAISERLKEQWAVLGLTLDVTYRPWAETLGQKARGEYDLELVSWLGDFADPATFIEMLTSASFENKTGWRSEAFEAKVAEAEGEGDFVKRLSLLSEAEGLLLQEAPLIPLFSESLYSWQSERLLGFSPNSLFVVDWTQVEVRP